MVNINKNQLKKIVNETIEKILKTQEPLDIEKIFKISSIPIEKLEKQYKDLSFVVSSSGYGGNFLGVDGKIIKENVSNTLSVEETKKQIQNKFKFEDWQVSVEKGANNIQLIVLFPYIGSNTELIKDAMSACGWSIAQEGISKINNMTWLALSFDPMFQDNVSSEMFNYQYVYHWTPFCNLNYIMQNGLIPKSENKLFKYPNRLYLLKGNIPQNELFNIGKQLSKINNNTNNDGIYVLLQIATNKLNPNIQVYYDPRYEYGYYVKDSIGPEAIKPMFKYNFNTNEFMI